MTAVFVTGGKQYRVSEGDVIFVEKLPNEAEETVTFDQVLAVIGDDVQAIGKPVVEGAAVTAKVVKNGKAKRSSCTRCIPKRDTAESRATDSPIPSCRSKPFPCKGS